ncbi:hypothetical protein AKJ51_02095 [candidate division MSBL1 archaeon SCGC-AAA382A20]|uniref:Uncharacterized protein n=1 Tax=candidate division MSBL1 archaeon SCGC-AAA382A20 TaxID=1698280 RepID=A0A133VKY7_9EURY|nr:hypothetical protein AKJ51_02095 [candidate division MSBL1 archaeon SCGC-AAA382A20]
MGTGSGALDASATLFNPPEPSSNLVSDILSRIFREVKFSNKSFSSGSHIYFFGLYLIFSTITTVTGIKVLQKRNFYLSF